MTQPMSSNSSVRRTTLVAATLLLLITLVGVTVSTTSDVSVGEPLPVTGAMTADERAYYDYVSPRLARLVGEVDDVVELVDRKSRDLLTLTLSGERIESLTDEILGYADEHGVPKRFRGVHDDIVKGAGMMTRSFGEAKAVLRRLNFSRMTTLIGEFNAASAQLHDAQAHLQDLVGAEVAEPPT